MERGRDRKRGRREQEKVLVNFRSACDLGSQPRMLSSSRDGISCAVGIPYSPQGLKVAAVACSEASPKLAC